MNQVETDLRRETLFVTKKTDRLALSVASSLNGLSLTKTTPTLPILYEDISALCTENTAVHSLPPHSVLTHLFCVRIIILWPIRFVCKVSVWSVFVCVCFSTFLRLYELTVFCVVYLQVLVSRGQNLS